MVGELPFILTLSINASVFSAFMYLYLKHCCKNILTLNSNIYHEIYCFFDTCSSDEGYMQIAK